jgi:hypothetical protein
MENRVHGYSFRPDLSARLEIFSQWKEYPNTGFLRPLACSY